MTHKGRGSWLENVIEVCNKQYRLTKKARIDKIPTPSRINTRKGTGYFTGKSTVDFTGFTKKGSVAFDTKQTKLKNFPFSNVHRHQLDYLYEVQNDYGVEAFLLIWFSTYEELYKVNINDYKKAESYFERKHKKKSIPYSWFQQKATKVKVGKSVYFDYLELED